MSKKVAEAMHAGVEWVAPDTKLAEIAKIMKAKDIGAVPVGENDKLVGMVTDRDMAVRGFMAGRDPTKLAAADVMTPSIIFCRAEQPIEEAVRVMEARQVRRLPVIDENKRMVGMLSMGDVCHCGNPDIATEVVSAVSGHHA